MVNLFFIFLVFADHFINFGLHIYRSLLMVKSYLGLSNSSVLKFQLAVRNFNALQFLEHKLKYLLPIGETYLVFSKGHVNFDPPGNNAIDFHPAILLKTTIQIGIQYGINNGNKDVFQRMGRHVLKIFYLIFLLLAQL